MVSCAMPDLCQFRIASLLPTGRRLRTRRQFRARNRHQPFLRQSRKNQWSPGARPTSLMTTSLSSNRSKQARRCKMSRVRLAGSGEAAERRQQVAPAKSAAACRVGKGGASNAGGLFGGRDRTSPSGVQFVSSHQLRAAIARVHARFPKSKRVLRNSTAMIRQHLSSLSIWLGAIGNDLSEPKRGMQELEKLAGKSFTNAHLSQARAVLRHSQEMATLVLNGSLSLDRAMDEAKALKLKQNRRRPVMPHPISAQTLATFAARISKSAVDAARNSFLCYY